MRDNVPSPRHTTSHARDISPATGRSGREGLYRGRVSSAIAAGPMSQRHGWCPGSSGPSSSPRPGACKQARIDDLHPGYWNMNYSDLAYSDDGGHTDGGRARQA